MVKLDFRYGLPFCQVTLNYGEKSILLDKILLDTGSGGTVFKMDKVDLIGITIGMEDTIETISGVGGSEFVYRKIIDTISLGNLKLNNFEIEVGVMDYGFEINGILGMDFMKGLGVIIDLDKMILYNKIETYQ